MLTRFDRQISELPKGIGDLLSDAMGSIRDYFNPPASSDALDELSEQFMSYGGAGDRIVDMVEDVVSHILGSMTSSVDDGSGRENDALHHLGLFSEHVSMIAGWRDIYSRHANEAQAIAQNQLSAEAASLAARFRDASQRCAAAVEGYLSQFQYLVTLLKERGYDVDGAQEYHNTKKF